MGTPIHLVDVFSSCKYSVIEVSPMSFTVRDVCTGALRLLGVTQPGRAPSAAQMTTAVYSLRSMLESWSVQDLTIYQTTTEVFTFVPNQMDYTMGPTGDWVTDRPTHVNYVYVRFAQGSGTPVDTPVQILNDAQRAAITAKTINSPIPTTVYINNEYPNIKLSFWPVPNSTYEAVIWSDKQLHQFNNISEDLAFPPGYEQAIRYNLALNLAPEFGQEPTATIVETALRSLAQVKMNNDTPRYLRCTDYTNGRKGRGPSPILNLNQ